MTGSDRPAIAVLEVGGGEDLAQGQSVGSEVVVAESAGLIGVVKNGEPPGADRRRGAGRHKGEFSVGSPCRTKVVGDLLLQGVDYRTNLGVGQQCTRIDDRDLDGSGLRHLFLLPE